MNWSDDYSTGIERVASQHRTIFRMSEDFRVALDAGGGERVYADLLQSLSLYTRAHFRFEEECMDRYQCPAARRNKEEHVQFAGVIAGFQERYTTNGFDRAEVRHLVDAVDQCLSGHICRVDAQLKPCVQEPRTGGET